MNNVDKWNVGNDGLSKKATTKRCLFTKKWRKMPVLGLNETIKIYLKF